MAKEYEETKLLHSAAIADANGEVFSCDGIATICVQLYGTLTTVSFLWEGTVNGTDWIGVLGWNRTTGVKALTAAAAGLYVIDVTGLTAFRARLDHTTGSASALAKGSAIPTTTLVTAS
jgi:hypothetical protein